MKKAWEHFGVEEEVFKTIVNSEEEFVKSMMKKRFGVDYDGIAVKTQIKKSETLTYELAESIIKLDINFVKKVQSVGKNYKNYFQNNNADMAKKIEMVHGLKHQELIKILEDLPAPQRTAFIYSFGIDRKVMPISKVAELLKKQEEEVILLIKTTFSALERKELNNTNNTQSKENDVPNSLISPLIKKGYEKSCITKAISSYDSDICLILRRVYGFDYSGFKAPYIKLNEEEKKIINDVISGEDNIESRIKSLETSKGSPIKLPVNLPKYCKKMGYEKDDLIDAYSNLTIEQKTLFKKAYDPSFNYIGKDLEQKDLDILKKMICSEDFGLIPLLKKSKYERYNGGLPQNLFSQFTPRGYTKKEVILGYKRLPKDTQILVLSKYDKDFRLRKDVYISKEAKEKLKKVINEDFEKAILVIEYAYDFAVSIGFTKEEFVSVLESLPNDEEKALRIYMSKDLILKKEISSQTIFMIQKKLPAIMYIERQKNGVSTKDIKLNEDIKREIENLHKIRYFYDYAVSLGFSKEEFIEAYNSFTLEEKTKLEALINEDFSLKRTIKSSESAYYISHVKLPALMYIEREKNNIDTTNIQVTNTLKATIDSFHKPSHQTKYLYDYAVSIGFTKEEFFQTYEKLRDEEKHMVEMYVNEDFSIKEKIQVGSSMFYMAYAKIPALMYLEREKNNINTDDLTFTKLIKKEIQKYKNKEKAKAPKHLYDIWVSAGFTKEEFIGAYNLLGTDERNQFKEYIDDDFTLKAKIPRKGSVGYLYNTKIPAIMYKIRMDKGMDVDSLKLCKSTKKSISNLRIKINKYIYDNALDCGFTKNEFLNVFKNLEDIEKDQIKEYINDDLSFKALANDENSAVYNLLEVKIPALMVIERIEKGLNTHELKLSESVKKAIEELNKHLYDYSLSIGFTKEEFIEVYNSLIEDRKNRLNTYINNNFLITHEITDEYDHNTVYVVIPALIFLKQIRACEKTLEEVMSLDNIDEKIKSLTNMMINDKKYAREFANENEKYYYDLYIKRGFTKEEFDNIYNCVLSDEERKLVHVYCDTDFKLSKTNVSSPLKEEAYKLYYQTFYVYLGLNRLENKGTLDGVKLPLRADKAIEEIRRKEKMRTVFDLLSNFNKELVKRVISSFSRDEKSLYYTYFDKKDVQIDVNLNVEIKNLIYNIIPIRIKKLIFEEKIQLETSIPTNLCDYFKNYTSRKDFIMYALLFLPHKYLEFFNYYYDEELMLKKGIKYDAEIFKLMNIVLKYKEEDLKEPIQTSSLQRILENLNEIVDLKAYFDHRGLKDKFEYAAGRIYEDKLSSVNCSIIKKHYDERFELKNDELSPKEINLLIKTLEDISLYLKKMEISDDEVMDYANSKNIKEYIEKIKSMHIFTSEMINSLSISGKALYFLSIEFIINKDSTFTLSDEAEILGISKNDLCNNLYTSIIEAKGAIEKIFNKNLKN